ncbi:MAG: D-tyrosyl-tRNA(Tyr) deacylase [Proteobacteria bacterium]|nr:D-tyrosyl-tRNA(Tyr) deacylase [Pseudomonadota bacterium]MCP4921287.1 D-tyrosyl-tRNA(Tyr) deacylase [Pseudomonadota bacterium]
MRAVLQRVSEASCRVDGQVTGRCGRGLMVLVAVAPDDTEAQAAWLARKVAGLRIFPDDAGKMNKSVVDVGGTALVVSQFTLYGDCRKGRRPSFIASAGPELAKPLYLRFCELLADEGVPNERGVFAADMKVALINDGPVTLVLDTP